MRRRRAFALCCLLVVLPGSAWAQHAKPAPAGSRAAPTPKLTKPPELVEFVEAPYPEAEKENPRAAQVVLSILIDAQGQVGEVQVIESAGEHFDAAASDAVKRFRFTPAELDGAPAPVKITYRYSFQEPVPPITTGGLVGLVRDKRGGQPLAGVRVRIEGVGEASTDEAGRFEFADIPAGTIQVSLESESFTPLGTTEEITAGQAIEAVYDVELPLEEKSDEPADDYEIVVRAPPKLERQLVGTTVVADDARRLPGTQGDVLKVVESLPGVARSSAGSGEVIVWGAAPGDTRTYVGAVRVPMLYHFGGLRSVVHGDHVAGVELVPGGYGAAYGRGLGGLVLVTRKDPAQDGLHGSIQADLLDTSVALSAPLSKKVSFSAGGRKSYIAELGSLLSDQSFQQYFTLPEYYDGQGRVRLGLSDTESIEAGVMISGDGRTRTQPSDDPTLRSSESRSLDFQRVDVTYRKKGADGSLVTMVPWYGHDVASRTADAFGVPQSQRTESNLVGFRSEWQGYFGEHLAGRMGLDFELVQSDLERRGSLTTPPREGDLYVFGRAPSDQVNYDAWSSLVFSAAPYAELDWSLFDDRLHVIPGVRVEPYVSSTSRIRPAQPGEPDLATLTSDIGAEPRLTVRYAPWTNFSLQAGGGYYRQPPLAEDSSAVFGNPLLSVASGRHLLAGARYAPWEVLTLEATAFSTETWNIGSRNPASNPQVAQALVQEGDGRSLGAQFMVRKERAGSRYLGWIAYTVLKSERRDAGQEDYRLFDLDQTHMLTALVSFEIGAGFEFGLRARYATGFPRTPVVGAFYDTRRGRYEPVLGEQNAVRIPSFFQLDARLSKRFDFTTSELEVYLDVQNATYQENAEEIAYSPDYSEQRYVLGLPILPVLGARWEF
jgi:TonB family protein